MVYFNNKMLKFLTDLSFSKRLLILFIISSIVPLFLLSFVFMEISQWTLKRNSLRQADDAIVLDNSNLTREEQSAWLLEKYKEIVAKC